MLLSVLLAALVVLGGQRVYHAPFEDGGAGAAASSLMALATQPQQDRRPPAPPLPLQAAGPDFVPLEQLTPLPAFMAPLPGTSNRTSYVLGATLTRDARLGSGLEEGEDGEKLMVDVFFMGVSSMVGGTSFSGIDRDPIASDEWRQAVATMTQNVRTRAEKGYAYACRFRLAHAWEGVGAGNSDVVVDAIAVPTATTVDGNVNDMVNILRCPLPEGMARFCRRYRSGDLQVALYEQRPPPEKEATTTAPRSLLNFSLPIAARSTGFLQPHTSSSTTTATTTSSTITHGLDPWSHLWDAHPALSPSQTRSVALCVAGLRSAFISPLAELTVEFIEHHLLQGVGTIVFGVDYDVGSKDWRRMELVLRQYMEEGRVVLSSTRAVGGREVHRELKKVYHYNHCLFWSKGLAEWVGVWDVDEFLTPRTADPHDNLLAVLDRYASPERNEGRDVGFLLFTSYSHALPLPEAAALEANASVHLPLNDTESRINWVGQRFAHTREDWEDWGYQKALLSAPHIYFTGFHLPGACTARIDPERDWARLVRDDHPEYGFYAKRVAKEEAVVMHFRVVLKPITFVWEASEYALHYFDRVLQRIRERGLEELLIQLKTLHQPCSDELARLGAE